MNRTSLLSILLISLLVCQTAMAENVTRLVWQNRPLPITLKPGAPEIRVIFPADVDIQVPVAILDKITTLQINPRVVYWTAKEPFPPAQVVAISQQSGEVYLIQLGASEEGATNPITIADPAWITRQQPTPATPIPSSPSNQAPALQDPPEIVLARFAAQTLYAPVRLLPTDPNIHRVPVNDLPQNFALKRSQRGEVYQYQVLGQWQGYGRYITAVKLKNTSPLTIDAIDLRTVRGAFTHIATQHPSLGPAQTDQAITTLYLISLTPFQTAVGGTSYGF